jgi:hypothetical protein
LHIDVNNACSNVMDSDKEKINEPKRNEMNELILYGDKIQSPFCEISFKLEHGATKDDLIESFKYWGIKFRDMEYSESSLTY